MAVFACISSFSQDIIVLKTGDEIKSKVLEVSTDQVKYKKWENMDGPTYTSLKSEVFMIKYQNGSKDVFNTPETKITNSTPISSEEVKKNEAVKSLENYVKNKIKAPLYFNGFRKTNGVMNNVFGQMIYTINFDIDLKFIANGWLKGNGLEGYWRNSFYVYPSEPDLYASGEQYMYGTKLYPSGTSITLGCIAEMNSTDNGFMVKSLSIKTETNYGVVADNNQSNTSSASINSQNTGDANPIIRQTTAHKGNFYDKISGEEYWSGYVINANYSQPSIKKNLFYRSNGIVCWSGEFGKKEYYKNDELIVEKGDSLSLILTIGGDVIKYKSPLYSGVWIGSGEYVVYINIADSLGKEMYKDSWGRVVNNRDKDIHIASSYKERIIISPEKLQSLPSSQNLYLSFLIQGKNKKQMLEGFLKFKVEH